MLFFLLLYVLEFSIIQFFKEIHVKPLKEFLAHKKYTVKSVLLLSLLPLDQF